MSSFVSAKGRTFNLGQLVAVHYNSHKHSFSIVEMKSPNCVGVVLGYANSITLHDCYVKINKSMQKRVRENGVKERHAFVVGRIKDFKSCQFVNAIYYKPSKLDSFVNADNYFLNGNAEYLEEMEMVNFSLKDEKPVVTYMEKFYNGVG